MPSFISEYFMSPYDTTSQLIESTTLGRTQTIRIQVLRRQLSDAGLTERIHGRNRVPYRSGRDSIDVSFTPVALQCFFSIREPLEDPEGRARPSQKKHRAWTCGIAGPDDVDYFAQLAGLGSEP